MFEVRITSNFYLIECKECKTTWSFQKTMDPERLNFLRITGFLCPSCQLRLKNS